MVSLTVLAILLPIVFQLGTAGTPCPPADDIHPCYCSRAENNQTLMICTGLQTSSELEKTTESMKSMIIDRFLLLGNFQPSKNVLPNVGENEIESVADNTTSDKRLPKEWLTSLRVKEIDIQKTSFASCFLCENPFIGQSEYLWSLVIKHSSLEGHLCSVCNTKIKHISTKEFLKIPNLKTVDFSHNNIKIVSGYGFPAMSLLARVILSNNEITNIYDNAFSNLPSLVELDLSRNKLSSVSRKMFHPENLPLKSLDLSWNSIQEIPENFFEKVRHLKEIKLAHNLLATLAESTFKKLPTLIEIIDAKGNFLNCNCNLSWAANKLNRGTKFMGKCVSPDDLEFKEIRPLMSRCK